MVLARFFTVFAGGDTSRVAAMVNSMSALASAFTVLFIFWTITHLARKIIIKDESQFTFGRIAAVVAAGATGAMAFAFSDSFWFSAVEGEVYASSSLFTAAVFWAILKWEDVADEEYSGRWLILIAFLMGLSIGVHLLNLLTLPHFLSLLLRLKLLNLTSKFPPLPGGVLDEQTDLMLKGVEVMGGDSIDVKTPSQARLDFRSTFKMLKSLGGLFEDVEAVRHLSIPSEAGLIPAWLYLPGPELDYPLLLYFHGGGFVTGDRFTADNICRFLCRRAGLAVLSVDYRLAPESPFPAAVEDCLVEWLSVESAAAPQAHDDPRTARVDRRRHTNQPISEGR